MQAVEVLIPLLKKETSWPVVTRVPRTRPEKFLRLDQGAATRINLVQDSTLVIIQVFGPDGAFDEVLGVVEKLREWLFDVDGAHPSVFGWEETQGPMEFPDPDLPEVIRWQFAGHLIFAP